MEIIYLAILGLIMGFINSVSGGSGIIGVTTMLALNIPLINVLVFNKISDFGALLGAIKNYKKINKIDWKTILLTVIPISIGAFIGSNFSISISENTLKNIIILAILLGIILILQPIKLQNNKNKLKINYILSFFTLMIIGIWRGAVGIAGGIFGTLFFVYFFHKSFLEARSTDIITCFPATIISLIVLYFGSTAETPKMLIIFLTSFIGAFIGSKLAIKNGNVFIKNAMVLTSLIILIKIIFF